MINKKWYWLGVFLIHCFCVSELVQARGLSTLMHGLYIGAVGGYGSTTWNGLVPKNSKKNPAMSLSTPIKVTEGGATFGGLVGYEFTPYFAIEGTYLKYPNARVIFDPFSIFSFDHNNETEFTTSTEVYTVLGKIMLAIPKTKFRAYSGAGIANLHREDRLMDDWRVSPSFSVGVIYPLTEHLMADLSGNYTAGFGESQINPADTYYPFLYSVTMRVAYRF